MVLTLIELLFLRPFGRFLLDKVAEPGWWAWVVDLLFAAVALYMAITKAGMVSWIIGWSLYGLAGVLAAYVPILLVVSAIWYVLGMSIAGKR
jgi:hypothetical protein